MPKQRNYTFKLYPDEEQAKKLELFMGHCRFVYNKFREINRERMDKGEELLDRFTSCRSLTQLKKQKEYEFLNEAPATALATRLVDLSDKIKSFQRNNISFPDLQKKGFNDCLKIQYPAIIKDNSIRVLKIGFIKLDLTEEVQGRLKSFVIKKQLDKWTIRIRTEIEDQEIEGHQSMRSWRFLLLPTKKQELMLDEIVEENRIFWNLCIKENTNRINTNQHLLHPYECYKFTTKLREKYGEGSFKTTPKYSLRQTLKEINHSYELHYKSIGSSKVLNKPKIKLSRPSFTITEKVAIKEKKIHVPKIGLIKFKKSRKIKGEVKLFSIKKEVGRWYLIAKSEVELQSITSSKSDIGIDLGVNKIITCSNRKSYKGISEYVKLKKQIDRHQRKLFKKIKNSKNYIKVRLKYAKLWRKTKNKRNDYRHKITTELAKKHKNIFVEDIKVKKINKSFKGTLANPGENVKIRAKFNNSKHIQGWYETKRQLIYKAYWYGGKVTLVDPAGTSITCRKCNYIDKKNRKKQKTFKCLNKKCGHKENADINAAKNILARGHRVLASGEQYNSTSVNEELVQSRKEVEQLQLDFF